MHGTNEWHESWWTMKWTVELIFTWIVWFQAAIVKKDELRRKGWQTDRGEHILDPELACRSLSGLLQISLQEDLSYTKWQLRTITPALTTNYEPSASRKELHPPIFWGYPRKNMLDSTLQEPRCLEKYFNRSTFIIWKVDGITEFNYHNAIDKNYSCWNL
jgi:hypothetical protein